MPRKFWSDTPRGRMVPADQAPQRQGPLSESIATAIRNGGINEGTSR